MSAADYSAHWTLADFDCLHLYSRTLDLPSTDWRGGFTVAFWFWADNPGRTQVILEHADAPQAYHRWEIVLRDDFIHFQHPELDMSVAFRVLGDRWHHFAVSIDPLGVVRAALDGQIDTSTLVFQLDPYTRMERLRAGGSTDPAGGHWDHTFGRNGSGLLDDVRVYARPLLEGELADLGTPPAQVLWATIEASALTGEAPFTVQFGARISTDQATLLWDFGDGDRATGAAVTHTYTYAGDYSVRLWVIAPDHSQTTAEQVVHVTGEAHPLRFVPVFVNGTEGYACYRIPSIVRALNGDLLAFAEARLESCSDSTGTIQIVGKRSANEGATWSPLTVVAAVDGYVNMNASPVVGEVHGTGKVVLVFRAASHSEWDIARGVGLSRAMCVTSDDHGVTWSAPRDITAEVHKPYQPDYADVCPAAALPENQAHDWRIQIPAQGHALQLTRTPQTRGRLFFAGSLTRGDRSVFEAENYAFWSDDLGATWQIGGIIPRLGLNEAIAAELEDGGVLINTRSYTNGVSDGRRAVTRAHFDADGAIHFRETILDQTLIDPAVQATLLRYSWSDHGGKSRLLFANPAHERARVNLTVRLSYDEGHTWTYSKVIERGASAYSDLVVTRSGEIGVLFERGNTGGLHFVRCTLGWLTDEADSG